MRLTLCASGKGQRWRHAGFPGRQEDDEHRGRHAGDAFTTEFLFAPGRFVSADLEFEFSTARVFHPVSTTSQFNLSLPAVARTHVSRDTSPASNSMAVTM